MSMASFRNVVRALSYLFPICFDHAGCRALVSRVTVYNDIEVALSALSV